MTDDAGTATDPDGPTVDDRAGRAGRRSLRLNPLTMSRRVRTLLVSGVLFLTLFVLSLTLPVPYVILSPGPTINTLGTVPDSSRQVIAIHGRRPHHTTGNLNLTTVSFTTQKLTVYSALRAWLDSTEQVVPRSAIFPPGQTTQQVTRQNTQEFTTSQSDAVQAALCELGYPKAFGVLAVTAHGPSAGVLKVGDVLVSVAGRPTDTYRRLKAVLGDHAPGDRVPVVVRRSGARRTLQVTLGQAPEGGSGGSLGIAVPAGPECLAPFTVNLGLADQIGGPSAGMMFALGIVDKLGRTDLTHGRFIAGTGTIDPSGKVGPIGGIQLKMIAARDAGATLFLAPAANCGDVRNAIPDGLQVARVRTLQQAIDDLRATARHKPVPHC